MQLGICCSTLQRPFAQRLAQRFEANLGITTVIVADPTVPLMESWEQASASDAVLLMLDRSSAPGPVRREDWQSLLAHNGQPPVAALKLEQCSYPKLLERSRFFSADGNELEAERWVERWLVSLSSKASGGVEAQRILSVEGADSVSRPDEWWTKVVDAPGVLTVVARDTDAVQTLASEAGAHFREVVWMGCEGVPPEALTAAIELRSSAVDVGRLLFVLVHAEPDLSIVPEGLGPSRHSFVVVEGPSGAIAPTSGRGSKSMEAWLGACRPSGVPGSMLDLMLGADRRHEWEHLVVPLTADRRWFRVRRGAAASREACKRHLAVLQESFRGWRRQPELCRELAGEAAWAIQRNRGACSELNLDLALFLLGEKRMVEAVTWLKILSATADERDEFAIQAREELRWLVDEFGCYRRPEPIESGEQDIFDFPEFFVTEEPPSEQERLLEELRLEAEEQAQRAASARLRGRPLQFDLFA